MALFALAHMSCAGAWAWGEVPGRLRAAGHEVVAPDLALVAGVTPADHARQLAGAVGDRCPVVVAGHSYGVLVALAALPLLGEAVGALVAIDGPLPDPGEAASALLPADRVAARRREAAARGDGMWTPGEPGPFVPSWWSRMRPMPLSSLEAPVAYDVRVVAGLPRRFVHCLRSDFGAQAERARARGWTVVEVDAVHALPLVDPGACAEVLLDAAHSVRPSP